MADDLVELKADLFCHGVRVDECIDPIIRKTIIRSVDYVGQGTKRASLSEGKCFLLHYRNMVSVANLAVRESFVQNSPYEFTVKDGYSWITKNGRNIIQAEPVEIPQWYSDPSIVRVFQTHGEDVIATALSNICNYKESGRGCAFCALEAGGKPVIKTPEEIRGALTKIFKNQADVQGKKELPQFREVNINSGVLSADELFSAYGDAIRSVREISTIPISAQMCPIEVAKLEKLKQEGLDTISFNLEIYDDKIRHQLMPQKAQQNSVKKYLKTIREAVRIFGKNQVSSWLIAGLEPSRNTIAGCEAICANGGIPHVAVFRPLTGTPLETRIPPETNDVIGIYQELKKLLSRYSLDPFEHKAGCIRCGGCSIWKELMCES